MGRAILERLAQVLDPELDVPCGLSGNIGFIADHS
jgi:hypothetical protein